MIILDTNVISEAMSPSPNAKLLRWLSEQTTSLLFTTTISLAEILYESNSFPPENAGAGY